MEESDIDFSTVKYLIHIVIQINGVAERSDVIGAIFGQTEGLLGDELDLRELQKTNRIGRILVNLKYSKSKRRTTGYVIVPSSLDRVETAILAAALETVDRVGPCEAEVTLQKIEDIRESKRKHIIKRAAQILRNWEQALTPETTSIVEAVTNQVRTALVEKYGPEQLPAGPDVDKSDSLIIVEGRADVINLLKQGIKNVIAVEGTSIPQTVIDLTKRKITTAFLDGDRGGELILRELLELTELDYVARAPPGREVEDLSGKEILKALRNRVPVEQVLKELDNKRFSQRKSYGRNKRHHAEAPHQKEEAESKLPTIEEKTIESPIEAPPLEETAELELKETTVTGENDEITISSDFNEKNVQELLTKATTAEISEKSLPTITTRDHTDTDLQSSAQVLTTTVQEAPIEQKLPFFNKLPQIYQDLIKELGQREAILIGENGKILERTTVSDLHEKLEEHEYVEGIIFDGIITQRILDIAVNKGTKFIIGAKLGDIVKRPLGVQIYELNL